MSYYQRKISELQELLLLIKKEKEDFVQYVNRERHALADMARLDLSLKYHLDIMYIYVYNQSVDEIQLPVLKCERCGHTWAPRKPRKSPTCPNPKCRSPYWQTKRWKGVKKP